MKNRLWTVPAFVSSCLVAAMALSVGGCNKGADVPAGAATGGPATKAAIESNPNIPDNVKQQAAQSMEAAKAASIANSAANGSAMKKAMQEHGK